MCRQCSGVAGRRIGEGTCKTAATERPKLAFQNLATKRPQSGSFENTSQVKKRNALKTRSTVARFDANYQRFRGLNAANPMSGE